MNRKVLFFDYDGTLICNKTKEMTVETKHALQQLKQNGHLLFLNTGRTKAILDERVDALNLDGFILGCGSYIEYRNELLYEIKIPDEIKKEFVNKTKEYHIDAFFEGTNSLYITQNIQSPRLLKIIEQYKREHVDIRYIDELKDDVVKMFICFQDLQYEEVFQQWVKKYFEYIDRGRHCVELVLKGNSKATGIQKVINYLNISKEDCYVFGDSNNDLPMFHYIENSALLGNEESLKSKVKFVCRKAEENGLVEALEKFNLL